MYEPFNKIDGTKFYQAFRTGTEEANRDLLLAAWEKCCTKKDPSLSEWTRCWGRGYTRSDGRIGCEGCLGTGLVRNGQRVAQ